MNINSSPSLYHRHLMDNMTQELSFSGGNLSLWQSELRSKLCKLLGYYQSKKTELNIRSLWKKKHELGSIEKIVFTSEPYCDAIAYVCLPDISSPPYKFFICLQGHTSGAHNSIAVDFNDPNKTIEVQGDLDFGINCMKNGFAALCIEQRCFGERKETSSARRANDTCHDAAVHALMLGKTILGERVYDVERGLDYLATRNDVAKIGIMGNSGGGYVSIYAAALFSDRLGYCMPSCSFCTFKGSIMSLSHCVDNYIPGMLKYAEMYDVMGLFAPKPVFIVAGKDDPLFPLESVKEAFAKLKEIYKAAGAEDNCHLIIGNGKHRFYSADAWPLITKIIK